MAMALSCVRKIEGPQAVTKEMEALTNNPQSAYIPRMLSSKQLSNVFAVLTTYYFNEKGIGLTYEEILHGEKNGWEIHPINTETIPSKVQKDKTYQRNFLDRHSHCLKIIYQEEKNGKGGELRSTERSSEIFAFPKQTFRRNAVPKGSHEMDPKMWAYLYRDLANEMRRTQKRILRRVLVVTDDGSVESRWQLLPERRRIQSRASR